MTYKVDFIVKIGNTELSYEEARDLYYKLHQVFGTYTVQPAPYPIPPSEWWDIPRITCESSNDRMA